MKKHGQLDFIGFKHVIIFFGVKITKQNVKLFDDLLDYAIDSTPNDFMQVAVEIQDF